MILRRPRPKAFLAWYLESKDLENSDRKPVNLRSSGCLENLDPRKTTIFPCVFPRIASKHLVYVLPTDSGSRLARGALRDSFFTNVFHEITQ